MTSSTLTNFVRTEPGSPLFTCRLLTEGIVVCDLQSSGLLEPSQHIGRSAFLGTLQPGHATRFTVATMSSLFPA